jgi:hypothetical protein
MRLLRTLCLAAVFQFDEIALARRTTRMTGDECCLCHVFRVEAQNRSMVRKFGPGASCQDRLKRIVRTEQSEPQPG